mgnify:FL=1
MPIIDESRIITPIITRTFSSPNGFTLSYVDLMKDVAKLPNLNELGFKYIYIDEKKDENGNTISGTEITKEQVAINKKIEETETFDCVILAEIISGSLMGKPLSSYTNPHNQRHIKINGLYLNRQFDTPRYVKNDEKDEDTWSENKNPESSKISSDQVICDLKSVLFTSIVSLKIEIDNLFLVKDANGLKIIDTSVSEDEQAYQTGNISNGDWFDVMINVQMLDPGMPYAQLKYHFVYSNKNKDTDEPTPINPIKPNPGNDNPTPSPGNNTGNIVLIPNETNNISFSLVDDLSDLLWTKYVSINTCSIENLNNLYNRTLVSHDSICKIFIDPRCPYEFSFNLNITYKGKSEIKNINYTPSSFNVTTPEYKRAQKMNNPNVSYGLLRVNPKLTGNVKVVVDSDSNLYLDTFKISDVLSKRKYRHINIGQDSYYGNSLMKFYKDIPTTEFYKIEDRCYDIFNTLQTLDKQFYDVYNYGVKTNNDKLYNENFSFLAPLCIKDIMPDFFLIFKVDRTQDDFKETMSDDEKIKYFINNGKLVKSFDMRLGSKLGTYIRTMYEHANNEVGDLFLSYDKNNFNKFIGIDIEHGAVAPIYESVMDERIIDNQVKMNEFYTSGFERNHIVSKDIINFEFMFNDEDADLFSINTYFGLYVKVNTDERDFSCIGVSTEKYNGINLFKFDADVNTYKPGTILSNIDIEKESPVIYGMTTLDKFIRLNGSLKDASIMNDYMLKPYKNIYNGDLNTLNSNKLSSFITLKINDYFKIGEHYRIIDNDNKTIYEVIIGDKNQEYFLKGSNIDSNDISEIITNYYDYATTHYTIKRVGLYVDPNISDYEKDTDSSEILSEVDASNNEYYLDEYFKKLWEAFRKLSKDSNFMVSKYKDKEFSILGYNKSLIFEKICSAGGFIREQNNYVLTSHIEDNNLLFCETIKPNKLVLYVDNTNWKKYDNFYLYPIDFEVVGNRIAFISDFIDVDLLKDDNKIYEYEISDLSLFDKTILYNKGTYAEDSSTLNIEKLVFKDIEVPIYTYDSSNYTINKSTTQVHCLKSYHDLDKYILKLDSPLVKNNVFSLFDSYPINAGLCSIFQIKDFDTDVLDIDPNHKIYPNSDIIGKQSEYSQISFFDYKKDSSLNNENYSINKSIFGENKSEESLLDYIKYSNDSSTLKDLLKSVYYTNIISTDYSSYKSYVPLLSSYVCKWKNIGTDARCENMRVMFDTSISANSYYVVDPLLDSSFDSYLGLLTFKNRDKDKVNSKFSKYITKSLDDIVISKNNGAFVKDEILNGNASIDDLIYDATNPKNKFTSCYLAGSNTIEFISSGIKFRINSSNDNVIDLSKYVGYNIVFINNPNKSLSYKNIDLIIDETKKEIALIWYSQCSTLEYGVDYSKDDSQIDIISNLITTPFKYDNKITEILCNNTQIANITAKTCDVVVDASFNIELNDSSIYYLYLSDIAIDNDTNYTKYDSVAITGKIHEISEINNTNNTRTIVLSNPFIWQNDGKSNDGYDYHGHLTQAELEKYAYNLNGIKRFYLMTDDETAVSQNYKRTINDLKNDLNNINVYVKTSIGSYDYSNYTATGSQYNKLIKLINISIQEPLDYNADDRFKVNAQIDKDNIKKTLKVHSGYVVPLMKDMLSFKYNTVSDINDADNSLKYSFDGANILIDGVNKLNQIWINKISDVPNYCLTPNNVSADEDDKILFRYSIDVLHDISIISDLWSKKIYRSYYNQKELNDSSNEFFKLSYGYVVGNETKSFLNSKGVVVRNDNKHTKFIDITSWKNTYISQAEKYIKLNVTDSLVYKILNTDAFNKAWSILKIKTSDNTYKINYIKNYILNFITINNKTKFELRAKPSILKTIRFNADLDEDDEIISYTNFKNELKFEDGKYYMYVYVNDAYIYYAKMTINL